MARAEASESSGSSRTVPVGVFEASTPHGGHDQPLPVLHDPQRPAPGHDPYGLGVYGGLAVGGLDDPALGLGNDLRGDEQDVPVDQSGLGRGDQLGEIVTGPHLGNPAQRPDPERGRTAGSRSTARSPGTTVTSPRPTVTGRAPTVTDAGRAAHARTSSARSNACRAISAVASTSVIISGTARQRIPAASTSPTAPASTVSTSQPSSSPEP